MSFYANDQAKAKEIEGKLAALETDQVYPLVKSLWQCCLSRLGFSQSERGWRRGEEINAIREAFETCYGTKASACTELIQILTPELDSGLAALLGSGEVALIHSQCEIALACPYQHSIWRPSYRSARAGSHDDIIFQLIVDAFEFASCGLDLEQAMNTQPESLFGLDFRIAVALDNNDEKVLGLIEQAILGSGGAVPYSKTIISAVIKSSNSRAWDMLGGLLVGAQRQEGARTAILELSNSGPVASQLYIIQLMLDNQLYRYPSTASIFYKWTRLFLKNAKTADLQAYLKLAASLLGDVGQAVGAVSSDDQAEVYLGLWALASHELGSALSHIGQLLADPSLNRRLVTWYFISENNGSRFCHAMAVSRLQSQDLEELAWVGSNLYFDIYDYDLTFTQVGSEQLICELVFPSSLYPDSFENRLDLYARLEAAVESFGQKNHKFPDSVAKGNTVKLEATDFIQQMFGLAAYDRSAKLVCRLATRIGWAESELRTLYYKYLLDPREPEQRQILINGLSDRSPNVRGVTKLRLWQYQMDKSDLVLLQALLGDKSAGLREAAASILARQQIASLLPIMQTLLSSGKKNQLLGGMELLDILLDEGSQPTEDFAPLIEQLAADENLPAEVQAKLAERVNRLQPRPEVIEYSAENGYGLFDPRSEVFDLETARAKRPKLPLSDGENLRRLVVPDEQEATALYGSITDLLYEWRNLEYETSNWNGSRERVLLGDSGYWLHPQSDAQGVGDSQARALLHMQILPITSYPLADQFLAAAGQYALDRRRLTALLGIWQTEQRLSGNALLEWVHTAYAGYPIDADTFPVVRAVSELVSARGMHVEKITNILWSIMATELPDLFEFALGIYVSLLNVVSESEWSKAIEDNSQQQSLFGNSGPVNRLLPELKMLQYWRQLAYSMICDDEQFAVYFHEMWYEYLACGRQRFVGLEVADILRAYQIGSVGTDVVYDFLTAKTNNGYIIAIFDTPYSGTDRLLEQYPAARGLVETTAARIASLDILRHDLPAPLQGAASLVKGYAGGIQHLLDLLAELGEKGIYRGSYYQAAQAGYSRQETISRMLHRCQPMEGDTPDELRDGLQQIGVSEGLIMLVAVFAPQWADLLEQATGIKGLRSGVWFLYSHLHIANEYQTELINEQATKSAVYSSLSASELNDGVFDLAWFTDIYQAMGEQRFMMLCRCIKYTGGSSNSYKRVQIYAEAVLGKLDKEKLEAEIMEKRNQDRLRAYALIPMDQKNPDDVLQRYEFIQRFRKESKQFGAARQASEGKACDVALENLAGTAGFDDVDRMTWALEGARFEQMQPLMEPQAIGEYAAWLGFDTDGAPQLMVRRADKALKSTPKEIAQSDLVIELKQSVKQLREQRQRARASLETAMVLRSDFTSEELVSLLQNPLLGGLAGRLIFMSGGTDGEDLGFARLVDGSSSLVLVGPDGIKKPVAAEGRLVIAHPYDLIRLNCWSEYQRYIYTERLVQPFKQVFREYYLVTADELARVNVSRRYNGFQVHPSRALALMKTRGWVAEAEYSLRKILRRPGLEAQIFMQGNLFIPAELELPAVEEIYFYKRGSWESVPFADVHPVVFSEVMRDIDLMVSVAHVGGFDPEASLSTIDMRLSIARELLHLLKVFNVELKDTHALIKGSLGEYSVHLGSGVVHKSGTGMINITALPGHMQTQGRIFLPFADSDPKTAEIMSEILLFAEDAKIKDPSILEQLGVPGRR